jgi:hypothetical protein
MDTYLNSKHSLSHGEYALFDLLRDLLYWAKQHNFNFDKDLKEAKAAFKADIAKKALKKSSKK